MADKRRSSTETRQAILQAARKNFAAAGFENATMRRIAHDAGCDPALIVRYFGSKQALFTEAVELPLDTMETAPGPPVLQLESLLKTFLETWHKDKTFTGIFRASMTNPDALETMRAYFESRVQKHLMNLNAGSQTEAAVLGAMLVGLAWGREIIELEPLTSNSVEEIARTAAALLSGNVIAGVDEKFDRPEK